MREGVPHLKGQELIPASLILGDRRPYSIIALYRIERLSGKEWQFNRYDKSLAQQYLDKVNEVLASRPVDRDLIDDFRPY